MIKPYRTPGICKTRVGCRISWKIILALGAVLSGLAQPALATHPCSSPLILDLDNNGVLTTSLNYSGRFDINGDGEVESIGWTAWYSEEAFLWLDLNRNRLVDDGGELFGDSMLLPDGSFSNNGFEALAIFDQVLFGGDEDGQITEEDLVWRDLLLWRDANHNGISEPKEIQRLARHGIVAVDLSYIERDEIDGNLNLHKFQGVFLKRLRGPAGGFAREQAVHDVFFVVQEGGEGIE